MAKGNTQKEIGGAAEAPRATSVLEGKKAPAFALQSSRGAEARLADYAGKKVVLYFYPKDATPGCTTEAQGFRDAKAALAKLGAVVLGVSRDTVASHCKFIDKHELGFELLSDPEAEVIGKYGAWGEKNMYGKKSMGIVRTTVLIDAAGVVRKVFPKVKVAGHVEAVLEALAAI
jgi:peroxiredoxin Q/BCP